MPTLSTENKKAMSREIIAIRKELEHLPGQSSDVDDEYQRALENDNLAKAFFDELNGIANAYYDERRSLNGSDSGRIVEQDFTDSKNFNIDCMFFPSLVGPPEDIWKFLIPKITDEVNGQNGGAYTPNEQGAIDAIQTAHDILVNGFNDGAATSTLSQAYTPGDGTLNLTSASSFQNGDRVITSAALGGGDGIFEITAGGGTISLTVTETISPTAQIPVGAQVDSTFAGFSNSERESGSSVAYPTVLNSLEDDLDAAVADWETTLAAQESALNANDEPRSTQQAQIAAAIDDIDDTQGVIDTWQVLPATGSGCRFSDTGLDPLMNEATARESQVGTRGSEIAAALGTVADNGDGTYDGTVGDIHYERYQWIETRLHRARGTAIEEAGMAQTSSVLTARIDGLTDVLTEYSAYMVAQAFEDDGDGSKELAIEDASDFLTGDTVYLLDDKTAEVERTVVGKVDNTLVLDDTVSAFLATRQNARIYKLL